MVGIVSDSGSGSESRGPVSHIVDVIGPYLPQSALLLLRATCSDFRDRVDRCFCRHMLIRDDVNAPAWWYTTELMRAPSGRIPCFMPLPRGSWLDPEDWKYATEVKRQRRRNLELLYSIRVLDLELPDVPSTFWENEIEPRLPYLTALRVIPNRLYNLPAKIADIRAWELVVFYYRPPFHPPMQTEKPAEFRLRLQCHSFPKVVLHLTYGYGPVTHTDLVPILLGDLKTVIILHPAWELEQQRPFRERPKHENSKWIGGPPTSRRTTPKRITSNVLTTWRNVLDQTEDLLVLDRVFHTTLVNMCIEPRVFGMPDHWGSDAVEAALIDELHEQRHRRQWACNMDPSTSKNTVTFLNGKEYMAQLSPQQFLDEAVLELEPGHPVRFLPGSWKPRKEGKRPPPSVKRPTAAINTTTTTACLNLASYIHIAERIIDFADSSSLAVLRQTCRAFRERVDTMLYSHLVIANYDRFQKPKAGIVLSSPRGILPVFPRRGWGWHFDLSDVDINDVEDVFPSKLGPFDLDQRRYYHYLCSLVRVLDYADGCYRALGYLIPSFTNVRVLRVLVSEDYHHGNPFPARTLVCYATPRSLSYDDCGVFIPRLCEKMVYHSLYHTAQFSYGIPHVSIHGVPQHVNEFVLVFSPFDDKMHPEYYEGPMDIDPYRDPSDLDDYGEDRRVTLVTQLAMLLLPNTPRIVRLVNMQNIPPPWLGFPADTGFSDIKDAISADVRVAIHERGEEDGWVEFGDPEPDSDQELEALVQHGIDRIVWMTGHEYYATIPAEDIVAESTIELVPGERHWLLPEVEVWTSSKPPPPKLSEILNPPPLRSGNLEVDMELLGHFDRWCDETDYDSDIDSEFDYDMTGLFIDRKPYACEPPLGAELLAMAMRLDETDSDEEYALDKLFVDVPSTTPYYHARDELLRLLDQLFDSDADTSDYGLDQLFAIPPPRVEPTVEVDMDVLQWFMDEDDDEAEEGKIGEEMGLLPYGVAV